MAGRSDRTLREIIRIIASRFWAMLAIVVIVVVCVALITIVSPKWYRSKAELLVSPTDTTNPLESEIYWGDKIKLHIRTLRTVMFTDYVLASAMLEVEGQPLPEKLDDQWTQKVNRYVSENSEQIELLAKRLSILTEGGPESSFTQTITVRVDWPEEPRVASRLGVDSRELAAKRSHDFAKAVISVYQKRRQQIDQERTESAVKFLQDKTLTDAKKRLADAAANYNLFVEGIAGTDMLDMKHMVFKSGAFDSGTTSLANKYRISLTELKEQIARVKTLKEEVRRQMELPVGNIALPDEVIAANPQIASLQKIIQDYNVKINELKSKYTEDYDDVRMVKDNLEKAQAMLYEEVSRQLTRLEQEQKTYESRIAQINDRLEVDDARLKKLAAKAATWQLLQSELDDAQAYYDQQFREFKQAQNAEALASGQNQILMTSLDDPTVPNPDMPRKPKLWINLVFALVTGIVLSLIYAFMADHFDHSLKSIDDAERYLGVPVLASVPKLGSGIIQKQAGGANV